MREWFFLPLWRRTSWFEYLFGITDIGAYISPPKFKTLNTKVVLFSHFFFLPLSVPPPQTPLYYVRVSKRTPATGGYSHRPLWWMWNNLSPSSSSRRMSQVHKACRTQNRFSRLQRAPGKFIETPLLPFQWALLKLPRNGSNASSVVSHGVTCLWHNLGKLKHVGPLPA